MAPLSRLAALPEEARRALAGLQLRSDTHGHLRVCEQSARQAADPRASVGTQEAARADPLEALIREAVAATSARAVTGVQLDSRCRAAQPLSTGSVAFDELLGGGLRRGEVLEVSGGPASGKTQLCLSAAACAAAAGLPVLYIDSTGGFAASRLAQLQQLGATPPASNAAARAALEAVRAAYAFDVHAALALLDALLRGASAGGDADADADAMADEPPLRPALLILDSASALISPLLGAEGRGKPLMLSLAGALRALADEHDVAVLMTNHTVSGRDGDTGSLKPALGETWKSLPHGRVHLTAAAANAARAEVSSAEVTLGRGRGRRCQYVLTEAGLLRPPPPQQRMR